MYGAIIGDIVGSKYEFDNIKTKAFPLFSEGCGFTDDTIMTVAVARAILLSRAEQFKTDGSGKGFRKFLVETMQEFGRRYSNPKGGYGSRFAVWLRQKHPRPYNSYGNGSAMRVSPCGLAAVTLEEAKLLARLSASVSHNHPEGIKGAESVAVAVFMAKCGKEKEEIRRYIAENYYALDFTLDSIRPSYAFDGSCQGSVPQAMVAFFESTDFEDAIRNAVSIGGDVDTTGAIAGSIAWAYYAIQTGGYSRWANSRYDASMRGILEQAKRYLPEEFIRIAEEFHEVCWRRAGTYDRTGFCTSIANAAEQKTYWKDWDAQQAIGAALDPGDVVAPVSGGREYSLEYMKRHENRPAERRPGSRTSRFDPFANKWCMQIQLDEDRLWFLTVCVLANGDIEKYSLDKEAAEDSHYEFTDEGGVRRALYRPGDEKLYFAEVLVRYVAEYGGDALLSAIHPFITAQFHYD